MNTPLILFAASYAAEAHVDQRRKVSGTPYVNHLLRVAHHATEAGLSDFAITAALLHDIVEDTPVTLEQLQRDFPDRVVELVRLLTQWWPDDAPESIKRSEKPKYYGAILRDDEAISIKLLDRADNLDEMRRTLPKAYRWADRYLQRTLEDFEPLVERAPNASALRIYEASVIDLETALGQSRAA